MQFIKENLFYSVLVAIILVVGGAVVAMGFTGAGSTDAKQALIVKNATAIVDLYRGEKVNQAKIGAKKEDVRRSGELLERTADNAVKWSKGRYQPIVVPKMEGGKKVGDVRAFPIDAKAYQKYDVPYFASGRYIALMNTIFEPLGPTVPPTRAEIEVEVERLKAIEDKNIERKKLEEAWKKRAAEIRGEGTEGVEDGVDPAPLRPGGVPIPPRGLPAGAIGSEDDRPVRSPACTTQARRVAKGRRRTAEHRDLLQLAVSLEADPVAVG